MFQLLTIKREGIRKLWVMSAAFLATLLTLSHSIAAPLSLDSVPLFVQNSAQSNIIVGIDDSGSMDDEVIFDTSNSHLIYDESVESFIDSGAGPYPFNSADTNYIYLFPNGDDWETNGERAYTNHYAVAPLPQYAFTRASDFNAMYYNPMVTYSPWYSGGTTTFTDMTATAAKSDPGKSGSSTLDLTGELAETDTHWRFRMGKGSVIPADTEYAAAGDSTFTTAATNIAIGSAAQYSIKYRPATYYVKKTTGTYEFTGSSALEGDCASPDTAHYEEFEDHPTWSITGTGVDALAYDGSCLTKVEITSGSTYAADHGGQRTDCAATDSCTYAEEMQNFANWFSYYRKRHLALRAGMGGAFAGVSNFNAGYFTINNRVDVSMRDLSESVEAIEFYDDIYGVGGNGRSVGSGTPNRQGLIHAGEQFMRTEGLDDANPAPVQYACQKNYTLFFTDGFSEMSGSTLADTALNYYNTPLRTGAGFEAGQVPVDSGCYLDNPDPSLDCNANLHMNTYTIGLGAEGRDVYKQTQNGVTYESVQDVYTQEPTWPDVNISRDKTQIDDLYRAAVNGRGEIFNADRPEQLAEQLSEALVSIQAKEGSATSVSFNTATLESDSNVFLALFNSALWSGDLEAYSLSATGVVSDSPLWSASDQLSDGSPSANSRNILTYNGSAGVPFRWANLTGDQQADLSSVSCTGCTGQQALNFIRGDRSNEGAGKFRARGSVLGDIVNGSPVYVGLPSQYWPAVAPFPTAADETYAAFKQVQRNASPQRTNVVYVGANDGMLHGFDAETGEEVIAYVPGSVYSTDSAKGLHYLAEANYQHQYYVDQAPAVSDVYIDRDGAGATFDEDWRTVLVGGLGAGGRGIFALDVTDPSAFSEANADDIVLWEFTSADDAELGYTFSQPTIAMMENGRWAAIFGNGYNSDSEQAKLFIVFLDGGVDGTWTDGSGGTDVDYIVLDTDSTTSNGLSSVRVLDVSGNGAADRVYAGDLQGRMWAFDLSDDDGLNPALGPDKASVPSWGVAYSGAPLFTAKDSADNPQPITSKPSVVFHPEIATKNNNKPNLMVFVGTGKFLESGDVSTTDEQTFYGVRDEGSEDLDRDDLVEQTISTLTDSDGTEYRGISNNNVPDNGLGWYIDLPATGERSVVDSTVRGDIVYFNTWIPSIDPCDAGGSGYLMSVSQANGSAPSEPIFDTNGDGVVDLDDMVDGAVPIGQEYQNGLPASSKFLGNKQYTPGTDSDQLNVNGGGVRDVEDLEGVDTGRLSWQELN